MVMVIAAAGRMLASGRVKDAVAHADAIAFAAELDFGDQLRSGGIADVADSHTPFAPRAGVQIAIGNLAGLRLADAHDRSML